MKHVKLYEDFLNENQVGYEVVWQDENKEHGSDVFTDIKDAKDKFNKLQKDGVIKVQINKLTKRSSSFSDEEQDHWFNNDPKFRSYLNSRMSPEDMKSFRDFLKIKKQNREDYFKKAK